MIRSRGLVWHLMKSFQKRERLSHKLKMKICKLGDVCKQSSLLKRITDEVWAKAPAAWQCFSNFLEKSYFNAIGSHFACV